MTEGAPAAQGSRRGYRLPILILVLGVAAAALWSATYAFTSKLLRQDRALIRSTRDIALALATSHLWLEELVAGDRVHRGEIWRQLDEAHDRAQLLLRGGASPNDDTVLEPLADERLRGEVGDLLEQLDLLRELARQRSVDFDGGVAAGPGTALDLRYDRVFAEASATTLAIERAFEARMVRDDARARRAFLGFLALWFVIVAIAAIALVRFEARRREIEAALRKSEAQLVQSQKMDAVGRLAGGLAHDINNFVTAITSQCELAMLEAGPGSPFTERMGTVIHTANKISRLIRRLLAFNRQQPVQPRVSQLNEIVSGLEKMMRGLLGDDLALACDLEPELWAIKIDPAQVEQIVVNLLVNAREASSHGGQVTIETSNQHVERRTIEVPGLLAPGDYVQLAVSDTGTGIPAEDRDRIFEPFFTTKPGTGSGLGLSTVYGIARQNGGMVSVYSEVGQGTTFRVYFPRCLEVPVAQRPTDPAEAQAGRGERVLLVEDNLELRQATSGILAALGYQVTTAGIGEEAVAILEGPSEFDLVISDVVMPGLSGKEILDRIRQLRGALPVLFISGYTDNVIFRHGLLAGEFDFLEKPFSSAKLANKVREILDRPQAAAAN